MSKRSTCQKWAFGGQIFSEIVAQLYSENSIQTLLIFSWVDPKKICLLYTETIIMLITNISLNFKIRTPWTWRSLRKHPFLLALRRRGRFARRNVCDLATEIPYWWRKPMFHNKSSSHGVPKTYLSNFTCLLIDFGKVFCSSANELQQNSNASSREDYIPQILTVLLEILRFYIWPLWPFVFCLSFVNNS